MAFEIADMLRSEGPLQSMRAAAGEAPQTGAHGSIGERVDMQLPTPFSSVASEILTHNTAANGALLRPDTVAELQRLLQAVKVAHVGDASNREKSTSSSTRPSSSKILPQLLRVANQLVPRVVFGTLFLAQTPHAFALLDAAWEQGVNAFDCAAIYGDGRCESVLGQWLTVRNVDRGHVWLMSKGGCHGQDRQWAADLGLETVASHLRGSLQRLGVSYLDLYLLHRDDETVSELNERAARHHACMLFAAGGCPHHTRCFAVLGRSRGYIARLLSVSSLRIDYLNPGTRCSSGRHDGAIPRRWPDTGVGRLQLEFLAPPSRPRKCNSSRTAPASVRLLAIFTCPSMPARLAKYYVPVASRNNEQPRTDPVVSCP